jgi:hypothetical protein
MKAAHTLCKANVKENDVKENHTRWSRVIREKLTGPKQVKNFNALGYVIKRNPPLEPTICQNNHSTLPSLFLKKHSNITLPLIYRFSKLFLSLIFPHQGPVYTPLHAIRATCPIIYFSFIS